MKYKLLAKAIESVLSCSSKLLVIRVSLDTVTNLAYIKGYPADYSDVLEIQRLAFLLKD